MRSQRDARSTQEGDELVALVRATPRPYRERTAASGASSTAASNPMIFRPASSRISTRRSSAFRPACRAAGGARRFHSFHAFSVQSFVDEVAVATKQDAVNLRLAMLGEPRQIPYSGHGGPIFDTGRLAERAATLRRQDRLGRQARRRPRHRHRVPLHVRRLRGARVRGSVAGTRAADPSRASSSSMSAASSIRSASRRR